MKNFTSAMFLGCSLLVAGAAFAQDRSASTADKAAADNTGVNKRDQNHDTATPTDQPNNKSDIEFAANVRSAIVKDKSLSTKAHNVKLVASGGKVVLRGPVANADEKARVEKIVSGVAGVTRVDNELDIAP
jgi:hyperosmotically inducible periplasmic protein